MLRSASPYVEKCVLLRWKDGECHVPDTYTFSTYFSTKRLKDRLKYRLKRLLGQNSLENFIQGDAVYRRRGVILDDKETCRITRDLAFLSYLSFKSSFILLMNASALGAYSSTISLSQ